MLPTRWTSGAYQIVSAYSNGSTWTTYPEIRVPSQIDFAPGGYHSTLVHPWATDRGRLVDTNFAASVEPEVLAIGCTLDQGRIVRIAVS